MKNMLRTVLVAGSVAAALLLAFILAPMALADGVGGSDIGFGIEPPPISYNSTTESPPEQTSDFYDCTKATRICFYEDINYKGNSDSFRCDQAGKQTFDYIAHKASSVRNNCRRGSAFVVFGKARHGLPAAQLRVDGQSSIPWLGSQGFNDRNDYVVRVPDGATTASADTPNDGHTCRGADTRICFFADRYFAGAEKSFKCDDGGTKKLGDLAQEASSVINNCRAGSAFRADGVPSSGGASRSFVISGQAEYGWLGYHSFDDTAQTVTRLS